MATKNNPFSWNIADKNMYDWTFNFSEEEKKQFSLQRYKELFLYFVSSFKNEKISMLQNNLFNDSWTESYNNSLGNKVFHLAVNCYLYYVGYRETEDCVTKEQKENAIDLLKSNLSKNSVYLKLIYLSFFNNEIKVSYIQWFLQEVEFNSKIDLGKILILPEVTRDFYVFTLLLLSKFRKFDFKKVLEINFSEINEIYFYEKYLLKEKNKKELFKQFLDIFGENEKSNSDECYDILKHCLESIFTKMRVEEAESKSKKINERFSNDVLMNLYKPQIEEKIKELCNLFATTSKNVAKLENVELLQYRTVIDLLDQNLGNNVFDCILFNTSMKLIQCLKDKKSLQEISLDLEKTDEYLDFLKTNSIDLLIGTQDLVSPYDYRKSEEFNKSFKHLYILGYYRKILALKNNSVSLKIKNIKINISIPSIEDMKDEYIEENEQYSKKNTVEKFSKEQLESFIANTYRNIEILADISVGINDQCVGFLITPKEKLPTE